MDLVPSGCIGNIILQAMFYVTSCLMRYDVKVDKTM